MKELLTLKNAFQMAVAVAAQAAGMNPSDTLPGSSYLYDRVRYALPSRK